MARLVVANTATAAHRRAYFQLVDATDGMTPELGEIGGQPQISTNGAAWTNTGIGALNAIGNGRYYADLTQAAVANAGDVVETRYKSTATAECPGDSFQVLGFDFNSTTPPVKLGNVAHGGVAATLIAERVIVASTTVDQPALSLTGNGAGAGAQMAGGAGGPGLFAYGGGANPALGTLRQFRAGFRLLGGTSGNGMDLQGDYQAGGSGFFAFGLHGIVGEAYLSGNGIYAFGDLGSNNGMRLEGSGAGAGLSVAGGPTGIAATFAGGSTSGAGISVTTTAGAGLSITPTGGVAIAGPAEAEIAAAVWDLATTGHTTAGTFGAAATGGGLNAYAKAYLYGDVYVTDTGAFEFRDADTPATKRLLFARRTTPGGRAVTKDPL